MKDKREQLLGEDLTRLFFKLSIPSILIGLVAGLYNLVDAIIVGQLVGPDAVGAVSLSYAVTLPNWAVIFCLGMGSASLLSRAIGANDDRKILKIPGNIIIIGGLVSLLLALIVFICANPLISFVGGKGQILNLGVSYIRILSLGFPFISIGLGLNLLVRGEGRMRDVMILVAISNVLNIILDYVLIKHVGMGVEGAATATVISQILAMAMILIYISSKRTRTTITRRNLRPAFDILPEVLKVGISPMMILILMAVQQIMMFRTLSDIEDNSQIIILSATFRLFTFMPIFTKGVAEGMQPVVGTTYGAGNIGRSRKALVRFTILGTAVVFLIYAIMMLFPRQILSMFITDASILDSGYGHFRLFFSTLIFHVAIFNITYYFLSIGRGKESGIMVISRQLVFFLPLVFILPALFGTTGLWAVIPACDILGLITGIILIRKLTSNQKEKTPKIQSVPSADSGECLS